MPLPHQQPIPLSKKLDALYVCLNKIRAGASGMDRQTILRQLALLEMQIERARDEISREK